MNKILKIGHRGAKGYEPENTLVSFQKALDMQVDGIELDVHLSGDGEIMVIHDETVDRTTDGQGIVNQLSLAELKNFRIDKEYQIPTLAEVLDLAGHNCLVNIELKSYETVEKVVSLIEKYIAEKGWKYRDFIVSSFDWNALQQTRLLNPQIPIGVLTATDLDLALGFAQFIKAESIHPHYHLLTAENTLQLQQNGLQVFTWTLNEEEDILKIKSMKVNGIITDYPNRI